STNRHQSPRLSRPVSVISGHCRHSRNGSLWNIRAFPPQSALMPVNLTTLPHFSVSSAISLPKSAGEPASTVPPKSASRAFILGSARPALISLFSFSTISAGVAFGAPTPLRPHRGERDDCKRDGPAPADDDHPQRIATENRQDPCLIDRLNWQSWLARACRADASS